MQQSSSIPVAPEGASDQPFLINTPNSSGGWRSVLSTIGILIAAPIVALLLTAFVFQSYEVEGPSMETTLQNRDRLIVWKVPRTLARITNNAYVPHRADVVIFVKHDLYEAGGTREKQLIKRIVGLPGDRVVIKEGQITIYNNQHLLGYNPDLNHDFSQNISSFTTGNVDLIVPDGQVFVCGDNRTNSLDSRTFGTISVDDIVGKLSVRIFPVSNFKSFI
jgi:signal peptidase I